MSTSDADSDRLGDRRRWLIEPWAVEVLISIRPEPSPRFRYGPVAGCALAPSVCERCFRTVAGSFGSSGKGALRSVIEVDAVGIDEMVLTPETGRDATAVVPDSLLSARARNVRLRNSSESSAPTANDSIARGVDVSDDGRGPLTTNVCAGSRSDGNAGGGLDGDGGDRRRGGSSMPLYASSGQSLPGSSAVTSGWEVELDVDGREIDAANDSGMPCRCRGEDDAEDDDESVDMKLVSGTLSTDRATPMGMGGDDGMRRDDADGGVKARRSVSSSTTPDSSIMLPTRSRSVDRRRTRGGRGRSITGLACVDESVEAG